MITFIIVFVFEFSQKVLLDGSELISPNFPLKIATFIAKFFTSNYASNEKSPFSIIRGRINS